MKSILILLVSLFTGGFVADNQFDHLRLNEIQVIGSHNSYKQAIDPLLFSMLSKRDSVSMSKIDYDQIPLSQQLDLGLRNLEIDVYADPAGGKYARPLGLQMAKGQPAFDPDHVMLQPGFKVFHIPEIDFRSSCLSFRLCLEELKAWSESHPGHYPVFITMNAKDEGLKMPGFVTPQRFSASTYDSLDAEITTCLGMKHLLTPGVVQGKYPTLETAVLHHSWPFLKNVKGKFIFILDETGDKINTYTTGHPSLKNRTCFTNSLAGTPEAAIMIMNDPKKDAISVMVKSGYIVRTRADSDTKEARINDKSSFEAACSSGAQIITTDYYRQSTHFNSGYVISFNNATYVRKNPVTKN